MRERATPAWMLAIVVVHMRKRDKKAHKARLGAFFAGLAPAMAVGREARIRLNQVAATGFSAFFYFQKKVDENLISDIFADLLSPHGSHGQGATFLWLFLKEIDRGGKKDGIRTSGSYRSVESCSVYREYSGIDIVLKLGNSWIGVENKPWAGEQPEQLQRYLEILQENDEGACVLYLSGDGEESETVPKDKLHHYSMIPYGYADNGRPSVAHWLAECAARCEADRVRWFLKDMREYIHRTFNAELLQE